ncbi:hypothetical protein Droror1_Dr00016130 [Drosera rotundifolia]
MFAFNGSSYILPQPYLPYSLLVGDASQVDHIPFQLHNHNMQPLQNLLATPTSANPSFPADSFMVKMAAASTINQDGRETIHQRETDENGTICASNDVLCVQSCNDKKKDRHKKIHTAHGVRDRRVRLSMSIARQFFNLQDMLRFSKASKTLEWLIVQAKPAIDDLRMKLKGTDNQPACSTDGALRSSTPASDYETVPAPGDGDIDDSRGESLRSSSPVTARGNKSTQRSVAIDRDMRVRARARARERTKEKMNIKSLQHDLGFPRYAGTTTDFVHHSMSQNFHKLHAIPSTSNHLNNPINQLTYRTWSST